MIEPIDRHRAACAVVRARVMAGTAGAPLEPRADDALLINHAACAVRAVRAHLGPLSAPTSSDALTATLDSIAEGYQAKPPIKTITLAGRIGRMLDPLWWSRNVRRELLRENEAIEHAAGLVRRRGQCYVSDHAMKRKKERAAQNRRTLERLEVVNDEGQSFNLAEIADGSVSNPKLRRSELMTRCRGFEETAAYMGHEAVFLTLTCPSRFHRFNAKGKPNDKWNNATPRDGQKFLNETWAKIRAEWKREGHAPYGFRVAEPHHDGCPHWHILLFAPSSGLGWFVPRRLAAGRDDAGAGIVGIAGRYACEDSFNEAGAIKHRFTCERIDLSKGSATGYIAKYISKNIDGCTELGDGIGLDFASGQTASKAAPRVRTWASTWGIRQFQQIGGPSVTVWRELRRLGKDGQPLQLELFEGPRAAADRALWALFWVLQGGPEAPRTELIKPQYDKETLGKYGDAVPRVVGVEAPTGEALTTRLHTWTVQRAGLADLDAREDARRGLRDIAKRHPELVKVLGLDAVTGDAVPVSEFERSGKAAQPWTGVNNCTDATDDAEAQALQDDFLRGRGGNHQRNPHENANFGRSDSGTVHHRRH
ncbi:MAG: replication endonuclease [Pseudomonadota bacterium]